MKGAVFKLRIYDSNKKGVPENNKNHLIYIGTRKGVLLIPGHPHGLFGFVNDKNIEESPSVTEYGNYLRKSSTKGIHAYRAVISLKEEDALRLGYTDLDAWKEVVKNQMPYIADTLKIKVENLEFAAGVHLEKDHPHCHIIFWDKAQGVKLPYVHSDKADKIRISITKDIFKDELSELYDIKNEARKAALDSHSDFFKDFLKPFEEMTDKEFLKTVAELKTAHELCDGGIIYNRFSNKDLAELAKALFELKAELPKSGRVNMKLMPPEIKEKIKAFAEKLLALNVDCKREFGKYIATATEIASYYNADDYLKYAKDNAENDLMKRLCNKILSEIKVISKMEYLAKSHLRQEEYQKQVAINLIT